MVKYTSIPGPKVIKVTIELMTAPPRDVDAQPQYMTISRDEQFQWVITGPVYPRTVKLIQTLNELFLAHDTGGA